MTMIDLVAIAPLVVLAASAVVAVALVAAGRSSTSVWVVSVAGLAVSAGSVVPAANAVPRQVGPLLAVDPLGLLLIALVSVASLAVALLAHGDLAVRPEPREEFVILLLIATLGAGVLVASAHLASLFLGIEVLGIALYGLIAYRREARASLAAGLKYLVLAGAASAVLLFGAALILAATGSLDFARLADAHEGSGAILAAGVVLLVVGAAFKLALVPLHMWAPDVYAGAPGPVAGFVATVSKGAVLFALLRLLSESNLVHEPWVRAVLAAAAAASMIGGNLLALLQDDVRRILAGSSIAHSGMLLVAVLAAGTMASEAVAFYLVAYFASVLAVFGVVTVVSGTADEAGSLSVYRGLFWRRPWLAAALTVGVLSLAGIPATAGFVAKFYVIVAGLGASLRTLVVLVVATSVLGLFYYLRIVAAMVSAPDDERPAPPARPLAAGVLLVLVVVVLYLGVVPASLQDRLRAAAGTASEASGDTGSDARRVGGALSTRVARRR